MFVFVHAQGIKTVEVGGGRSKNGKILSIYFLNAPQDILTDLGHIILRKR